MSEASASFDFRWASDHGLLVRVAEGVSRDANRRVVVALAALRRARIPGFRDLHAGYATVLVTFDPSRSEAGEVERAVRDALAEAGDDLESAPRRFEIPVCYDPEYAPDLEDVARSHALHPSEVVRLHAAADYTVCFLGFSPGFPYLAGLPERLATPRLEVPRRRVPAGSVAIGGAQAGIYPFETPGGWRIVGRTSVALFRLDREPPALLAPGDRVRFLPVDVPTFLRISAH